MKAICRFKGSAAATVEGPIRQLAGRPISLSLMAIGVTAAFSTTTRAPAEAGLAMASSVPNWPRSRWVSFQRPGLCSAAVPNWTISQTPGAVSIARGLPPANRASLARLVNEPDATSTQSSLPSSNRQTGPA